MKLRMIWSIFWRLAVTTIVLSISFAIGSQFIVGDATSSNTGGSFDTQGLTPIGLVAIISVQAIIFSLFVYQSTWTGWKMVFCYFFVHFFVSTVLPQMDTWFFAGAFPSGLALQVVWMGLITAMLFSPMVVLIWRRIKATQVDGQKPQAVIPWFGVGLVFPTVYLVIYFLFGYFMAWQVEELRFFYSGSVEKLPFFMHLEDIARTNPGLFAVQLFRGVLWSLLGWLIVITTQGGHLRKALLVAAIFTVPVTLLLMPNPYMPEPVRMAHFWETLVSNLIFGFVLGWFLERLLQK